MWWCSWAMKVVEGFAANANLQDIVHGIAKKKLEWCIFPWYARVPTKYSLADYPSRLKKHEMLPEALRVKFLVFQNIWQQGLLKGPRKNKKPAAHFRTELEIPPCSNTKCGNAAELFEGE